MLINEKKSICLLFIHVFSFDVWTSNISNMDYLYFDCYFIDVHNVYHNIFWRFWIFDISIYHIFCNSLVWFLITVSFRKLKYYFSMKFNFPLSPFMLFLFYKDLLVFIWKTDCIENREIFYPLVHSSNGQGPVHAPLHSQAISKELVGTWSS